MPSMTTVDSIAPMSSAHAADNDAHAHTHAADDHTSAGLDVVFMGNSLFDHIAVRWGGDPPQGFNPQSVLWPGNSQMHNERGRIDGVKHFNTTPAQNEHGKAYTHRYLQDHPQYKILGDSCVDYVEGLLHAEGIPNVPSAKEHVSPANYFKAIPAPATATSSPDWWLQIKERVGK